MTSICQSKRSCYPLVSQRLQWSIHPSVTSAAFQHMSHVLIFTNVHFFKILMTLSFIAFCSVTKNKIKRSFVIPSVLMNMTSQIFRFMPVSYGFPIMYEQQSSSLRIKCLYCGKLRKCQTLVFNIECCYGVWKSCVYKITQSCIWDI